MPYLIPDVIDPPTRVCIPISVPNDPQHLQVFWGHLGLLGKWYAWERDADHLGKQVAAVWGQTWIAARNAWALGGCMGVFDLRQTGILLERQNESGGLWSTLYDPRPYVLLKAPTSLYPNTVSVPLGVAGLTLNSVVGARAGTNDAILNVRAGWGAPAAIFSRPDNNLPVTPTVQIEHNFTGGIQPGLDFLRAMDTAGNKLGGINAYGNPVLRRYTVLPSATVDHYGSLVMLNSGFEPNDGLWYGDYNPTTGTYIWRQGIGKPGEDGIDGHGVDMLDPALQAVLYPNQNPEIVKDDALPSKTFIGFKLPRAALFSKASDIVRKPNENPTVALTSDVHGDKILQFGIPRAQKIVEFVAHNLPPGSDATVDYAENGDGDSLVDLGVPVGANGSSAGFDDVLPGLGDFKDYAFLVPADTLFNLPFRVPAGSTISNIVGRGYWTVFDTDNARVVGSAGTVVSIPGGTDMTGRLDIGKKSNQTTDNFTYQAAVGSHVFTSDTWVSFAQHRVFPQEYGGGWLWVSFRLTRAGAPTIALTYGSGGSGVSEVEDGGEFDLVLGNIGAYYNGFVSTVPNVNLTVISVTGWSSSGESNAWGYQKVDNSFVFQPAPIASPPVTVKLFGANSATPCTIRLRATIA